MTDRPTRADTAARMVQYLKPQDCGHPRHEGAKAMIDILSELREQVRVQPKGYMHGLHRRAAKEITSLRAELDAALTPAETMARCPEVAALINAARVLEAVFSAEITRTGGKPFSGTWSIPRMGVRKTCNEAMNDLDAALAAFTKGSSV